jgi:putative nucleotidyltransferase with HDIG domain
MSTDNLESNYNIFVKLTQKCGDRSEALLGLVNQLGERLAICPAHDRRERSTAKPGGLIEHSLNVVKTMKAIETSIGFGVDPASMILVGLYHDIGKVGDLTKDYYLEQTSDWHRDKAGILYTYNPVMPKMPHSHRSLALLQSAGVTLNTDEWIAIASAQGPSLDENKFYVGGESPLTLLAQTAIRIISQKEKVGDT